MMFCECNGCDKRQHAKGLCRVHYARFNRHGSTDAKPKKRGGPAQDFIKKALEFTGEGCLIWPFYRNEQGYAFASIDSYPRLVHKYVCEVTSGLPPFVGAEAAHSCGRGDEGCINPAHLSWKTRTENEQDKKMHGTWKTGSDHPFSKVTHEQVDEIRRLKGQFTIRVLGPMFGISASSVSRIHRGQRH